MSSPRSAAISTSRTPRAWQREELVEQIMQRQIRAEGPALCRRHPRHRRRRLRLHAPPWPHAQPGRRLRQLQPRPPLRPARRRPRRRAVRAPPKKGEKYWGLLRVDTVNGMDPNDARRRPHFDELTPIHPIELINLEADPKNLSQRLVNLVNPIGKGQRALVVSPPKAGKTMLLKNIANGITANYPEILLMVALIGERPEEVTDMRRSRQGRGHLLDLRRAHREPHARRRDGARDRQAPGRDRPRRGHPARLDHAPLARLQPGPAAVGPHAVRWHRPDRPVPAQALLRRRPQASRRAAR